MEFTQFSFEAYNQAKVIYAGNTNSDKDSIALSLLPDRKMKQFHKKDDLEGAVDAILLENEVVNVVLDEEFEADEFIY